MSSEAGLGCKAVSVDSSLSSLGWAGCPQSAGITQTGCGRAPVPYLGETLRVSSVDGMSMSSRFPQEASVTSGEGQRAPDGKHMALKANSRWHQLLKVTLYYSISGFTSKLYFYRYAPMQLNVALLSR